MIDGLVTPERIPDTVAYSLFFNFFSDRADSERAKLQSYCRQTTLAGVDLNALLAVAQHYRQRVADVDARAQAVRADGVEQPRVQAQLALLQAEKDAIIQDVIASLPTLVGPDAAAAIRTHVNERVKRKTKIVPGPKMPDGMPGHTRP